MGREFELKYAATGAAQAAIRGSYGPWQEIRMETTYFDTADSALSARHMTLRLRRENDETVCTLKTPLPDGSRGEWELECGAIEDAVPALCKLGAPAELEVLARKGLVPSCAARFTRLAAALEISDATVELALDQGWLLGGGKELPFAEVEVELKSGREEAATAFAEALAAEFALIPEPKSKVQRALELANQT